MPMAHSTKPQKPRADFPLFPHQTRRWAKKILGKTHYFGPWDDPEGALNEYLRVREYLHAGKRPPKAEDDRLTVDQLGHEFLKFKESLVESGEIQRRTFEEHRATTARVAKVFGRATAVEDLMPEDFKRLRSALGKQFGLLRLGNEITRARSLFLYAVQEELVSRPVSMGKQFKRPARGSTRKHRASQGDRSLSRDEIHKLLEVSTPITRSMILLGINAGLGNSDIGLLEFKHLDLKSGWISLPRNKTGVLRKAKLWKETIEAVEEVIENRKTPIDPAHSNRVLITKRRGTFYRDSTENPVSREIAKLFRIAEIDRPGIGHYALRRSFATVAGNSGDQIGTNLVMGHSPPDDQIASIYRQSIDDSRLEAVAEFVHNWLFKEGGAE
jgi:integrase